MYFLSWHVFQREKRVSHSAEKTVGLISGCHVYPFSSFSTPPLPISSSIFTNCNPPYPGPHSGTRCFPNANICLGFISHVFCVSQESTHTHKSMKLSVTHPAFAVPWRDTQQSQIGEDGLDWQPSWTLPSWVWLGVNKHAVSVTSGQNRQIVPRVKFEQFFHYCTAQHHFKASTFKICFVFF